MERSPSAPQLLVSVRCAAEAREAVAGGCDILDVKEPSRGSLGAASGATIRQIFEVACKAATPLSAAMGECAEWGTSFPPFDLSVVPDSSLQFVKLGLAGLGENESAITNWLRLAARIGRQLGRGTRHVAVIYADGQTARSPHPATILDRLSEHLASGNHEPEFAGVLVDTFGKGAGRLTDTITVAQLLEIRARTRELGLFLALAGRVNSAMLPEVLSVAPDIVAIRSAACVGEDRRASVRCEAVADFRHAMNALTSKSKLASKFDEASHV